MKINNVPPHALESEEYIIGAMLHNNKIINFIVTEVSIAEFYGSRTRLLYRKIYDLYGQNKMVDIISLNEALTEQEARTVDGAAYIASLMNKVVDTERAVFHAKIVKNHAVHRMLIESGRAIAQLGEDVSGNADEKIAEAQMRIADIMAVQTKKEVVDIVGVLDEYERQQKIYEEKRANGQELLGYSYGFKKLDSMTDGIRDGHLIVIGGYTNTGKTAFSLNILRSLLEQKKKVAYFSLEMTKTDIVGRYLGLVTNTSSLAIMKSGTGSPEEMQKIEDAKDSLRSSRLEIHTLVNEIEHLILQMKVSYFQDKVDCFFVDFIQLITKNGARTEYEEITTASRRLQQIAQELQVPIIVLSQVNNEHAKNGGKSQMIGLKGSGAIAAAADLVCELVPAESYDDITEKQDKGMAINIDCVVKKNRHERKGTIQFAFQGRTGEFSEGYETTMWEATRS